jgi:hypothetical protein
MKSTAVLKPSTPPMLKLTPPRVPRWKPPAHLSPASRRWAAWVRRTFELEEHHLHLLVLAAEMLDRGAEARAVITGKGLTYDDRFGAPHARPEVGIERDCKVVFARLLRELGLDISAPGDPRPPGLGSRR